MGRNKHAVFVRLIHSGFQFVQCCDGLIDHLPIRLEGEHSGRCDLGVVGTVLGQFAHPGPESISTFRLKFCSKYRPCRHQARTLDAAAVDFLFQVGIGVVTTVRSLCDERGVAGFQTLSGAVERLLPLIAFAIGEVDVPIDKPRQHGCLAQVDHLGTSRNLHTSRWSDICNAVAPDEHHLIGKIGSRLRIEHPAGSNGNNLQTL